MTTPLLTVSMITKRFGGLVAVDSVSFDIEAGQVVGLLGPNGSGKSTVLNMLSGAIAPSGGDIVFCGEAISNLPAHVIARKGLARTFQLVRLTPSLTVRDNVKLALAFGKHPLWGAEAEKRADEKLEIVGLAGLGNIAVDQLNYIDQKRVELARALAADPVLLLLDEWLAGLNPTELKLGISLINNIQQSGATILLVEHIMEAVRALCKRCIVMSSGSIIANGSTDSVLSDKNVIEAYLGSDAHA